MLVTSLPGTSSGASQPAFTTYRHGAAQPVSATMFLSFLPTSCAAAGLYFWSLLEATGGAAQPPFATHCHGAAQLVGINVAEYAVATAMVLSSLRCAFGGIPATGKREHKRAGIT